MTGEEFKKYRKDFNLSREQTAFDLCVSKSTIDSWESERRNIPLCCEKLFCLIYGIPFNFPGPLVYDETPDLFQE